MLKKLKRYSPHQGNKPLDLIIYTGGIAVLWHEGPRYKFYNNGEVLIDTDDLDDALDVVDDFCERTRAILGE